ncbi:LPXTG cell wall anchor domain-containing protein [Ruminococcus flavefaciens]|uniref:LPXTG-motif cell wall anchor domain-containing protein n=1 Tax=Ruminococcus flavefaciens TaxID=1265 RepID=A0A1K1PHI9_RUMFL|nr:LPXTG cell wall anchor domain-containing protein [Ruminococcus flavefaciens]SFW46118.1 LPXTG-motif cell wall anchor domain-containing protein [Ruminococcus flavefaciens]
MNNSLKKYLHELRMEKKQKRRLTSFITAMSVLVSTGVFWQLRGIGTAMTDETLAPDTNGQSADMSLLSSSLCETDEVWESTLPELTDELAENAALIAASQLGYTENTQNYIIGDDGCTHKNYSRYGAWFGNPYGDWNTMFTCFCLHYAGVTEADIPFSSGCWAWSLKLSAKGVLSPFNKGSPKRGDVLLFDTDLDGKADRSGIISEIISDTDNPCIITIEGQTDGAVAECSYQTDDEHIFGYVPVETPQTADETAMKFTAESVSGIKVSASAEQGIFPDGTKMLAADISREEAIKQASDALGAETADIEAVAVDISFISPEGIELEPADSSVVHVEIDLPEEQKLSGSQYSLLHIADSGGAEIVENAAVSESGAVFDADSFSIYVVTALGEVEKEKLHESLEELTWLPNDNGYVHNSPYYPYIIQKGDTISIAGYSMLPDKWFYYDTNRENEYKNILIPGNYDESQSISVTGSDGNTYYKKVRKYTANKAGDVVIKYQFSQNDVKEFYVRVLEEKLIDYDFLSIYGAHNNQNNPIEIETGDTIRLKIPISRVNQDAWFYFPTDNNTSRWMTLESSADGNYKYATLKAFDNTGDNVQSVAIYCDGEYKTIYIKVRDANVNLTHADIEIAEGGMYKATKKVSAPDGSYIETITEYEAYVANVNRCDILDSNGSTIQTFFTDDYYRHGNPGDTQYELTSNYIKCEDPNANPNAMKIKNGDYVYLRNDKNFSLYNTDTALFDIQLLLVPKTETVTKYNASGNIISSSSDDISSRDNIFLDSVNFEMDHQSVIDALNKCPTHTGLDFTIKADLNEVFNETLQIYKLPSTGGSGVVPYMITGSAVIILSFAGLLLRKRKEDK